MADRPFPDIVLFTFVTLSTIGYGNISPTTTAARLFCIPYAAIGIPMTLLTLANLSKYLASVFWNLHRIIHSKSSKRWTTAEHRLPTTVLCALYFISFMVAIGLSFLMQRKFTFDDVHFSLISFSTVGFGERSLEAESMAKLTGAIAFLVWGIILTTSLFAPISNWLYRWQFSCVKLHGTKNAVIWFGDQKTTVKDLLFSLAGDFQRTPREMRKVIAELDDIISAAIDETSRTLVRRKHPIDLDNNPFETLHPQSSINAADDTIQNFLNELPDRPLLPAQWAINRAKDSADQVAARRASVDNLIMGQKNAYCLRNVASHDNFGKRPLLFPRKL